MAQLIVVGFKKDMYRASEVLNQLQSMNDDWVVDLHDAVASYRSKTGGSVACGTAGRWCAKSRVARRSLPGC